MQPWIIGNWKLNPSSVVDAQALAESIVKQKQITQECHVVFAPSFVHLLAISDIVNGSDVRLASQDVTGFTETTGAFTGDVSAAQLADMGVEFVIIGHSERRQYYHEDNDTLVQKMMHSLQQGLGAIVCVGESEQDYDQDRTMQVLTEQLSVVQTLISKLRDKKLGLTDAQLQSKLANLIIAYEPVWAIGTGKIPTVSEVEAVHAHIRQLLGGYLESYDEGFMTVPIVYGGSVKPKNADEFATSAMIDGVLVGGAALNANDFISIAQSFVNAKKSMLDSVNEG